jgi:hypothetical protein
MRECGEFRTNPFKNPGYANDVSLNVNESKWVPHTRRTVQLYIEKHRLVTKKQFTKATDNIRNK